MVTRCTLFSRQNVLVKEHDVVHCLPQPSATEQIVGHCLEQAGGGSLDGSSIWGSYVVEVRKLCYMWGSTARLVRIQCSSWCDIVNTVLEKQTLGIQWGLTFVLTEKRMGYVLCIPAYIERPRTTTVAIKQDNTKILPQPNSTYVTRVMKSGASFVCSL